MSLPGDETTVRVGGEVVRHRRDPWTTVLDAGYRRVVGPALFALDGANAERAHERALAGLQRLGARPALCRLAGALLGGPRDPVTLADITFPGRVGLAAGMDKNAVGLHAWPALGFGHVELGTVTARPQHGNDRPRLFRLRDSTAVINRMGFNNDGSEAMAHRLCAAGVWRGNNRLGIPVGVSIGKSKSTPLAEAPADYLTSLRRLAPHADYLAINVSSPNTPGLRSLQDATALREVVTTLIDEGRRLAGNEAPVPLFVKIAPDLTFPAIDELLAVCLESGVSGLIATNTTLARDRIAYRDLEAAPLAGGLSGAPLLRRALEVVAYVARRSTLPLIGVGGITTPDDARRMMDAGAAMVQVFTGLVYRGPGLVRGINRL